MFQLPLQHIVHLKVGASAMAKMASVTLRKRKNKIIHFKNKINKIIDDKNKKITK